MQNDKNQSQQKYHSGNKFYILNKFDDDLQEGIIVPLTDKIEHLSQQRNAVIDVYINSTGGDYSLCRHLVSLFELAKKKEIKVRTIVPSLACSAGSMLAVAGTKGERFIDRSAEHLIHYGQFDGSRKTTPLQIERNAQRYRRHNKAMIKHYQKYCEIPDLEDHLRDDDFWIPAQRCIKWGIADKYMEEL